MNGKITITEAKAFRVHTYTSPDNGWSVNSHLVELANQVFIVDAQLLIPYGKEVAAYAASINKPLTRLYVTHHHPDHFFGAGEFSLKISSLAETATMIETVGDTFASAMHTRLGDLVPATSPKAEIIIEPGTEVISGITMELIHLKNAETTDALVIGFPDHGILITQDMLYHNIHPYLGDMAFDDWVDDINQFKKLDQYVHILPGHGDPGGRELYDIMLNYLAVAKEAYSESDDFLYFIDRLRMDAPNFHNEALLKLSERYMYPKK